MQTFILGNEDWYCAQHILPSKLADLRDNMLPTIYASFDPRPSSNTRHSSRKLLYGELDGVWQTLRLQDSKPPFSRRARTCIIAFVPSSGSSMSPTSVTCERSFGGMRDIKNYLRTTMTSDRLSSLALIHVHKGMNIDPDQVINGFASEKCRKLDFF